MAAMVGIEVSMIQILGHWHSAAFLQYNQDTQGMLATLGLSTPSGLAVFH